ncbi:uncharacterized protein EHS24_000484 [Apiotrichum porosum]|uniref:Uncharacterized protein n=1 Tax=Apiotrichum porosum TaxID=105984 RepID=A0A427Y9X6_9TREE|nr:uncharacterized protein EHS24_000484 [Apiotrichum porosum]RSH87961.1 hypothetical protein EHS24_000484 [Apiotrichum porosum]
MSQRSRLDPYAELIDLTDSPVKKRTDNRRAAPSHGSSSPMFVGQRPPPPLASSQSANVAAPANAFDFDSGFGASIAKKSTPSRPAGASRKGGNRGGMESYIKPSSGAFGGRPSGASAFDRAANYRNDGWPSWTDERTAPKSGPAPVPIPIPQNVVARDKEEVEENGEDFDIGAAQYSAADFERCGGDPEEQMRELLAGAVGDGEEGGDDEGDDTVEGFADGMRLMPHQVRGTRWMRERESGRKYGGILADDMGLGKTVQTLARIVEGRHTPAEKKVYKGGTLIIAPLAVMEQWATEVRTKTKTGLLKVTTHHGPKRTTSEDLEKFDVVITTFQVLSSEFGSLEKSIQANANAVSDSDDSDSDSDSPPRKGKGKGKGKKKATKAVRRAALFDVKWLRVVIDEAQNIKNHKTAAAKSAVELRAKYRWCLTGTPIQNNVEELYSLFKFLRARPLDNWQTFRSRVSSEVKAGRTGVAMKRLHIILKAIMLRRTKDATINGKPILNLPERRVEVVECTFDAEERQFYDALEQRTALTFNKFLRNGSAMSNYTSVLSMLLRLRQACDHPALVTKALAYDVDALENSQADQADELADLLSGLGVASEKKCEICFVVLDDQKLSMCPECNEIAVKAKGGDCDPVLPPSSAKIRKLLELLSDIDERSDSTEKTIVFSQFTSFLDLVEPFLVQAKIKYVRYDGTLTADQRAVVLEKIRTKKETRVILISFKAGSTGLNLTCCNNVVLMDMWWNPALEDQAFDRAHRLGQKLDVNIHKLTIGQTVEDRILALQTQKRELAQAALNGSSVKNMKLTMADIMKLFQRSSDE